MSLMDIGSHCEVCLQVDFLPFTCSKCNKTLCAEHREIHECTKIEPEPLPTIKPKRQPERTVASGRVTAPVKMHTPTPDPAAVASASKKQSALAKLRAALGVKSTSAAKSQKTAKSSSLTLLKSQAKGDPAVSQENRLYVYVERPEQEYVDPITGSKQTRAPQTAPAYFDKTRPVGFALDKAKKLLGDTKATGFTLNGGKVSSFASVNDGAKLQLAV